jgi:hypothetical protein
MDASKERSSKKALPYTQAESGFSKRTLFRGGYDPRAVLRWGQMQAVALLEVFKAVEGRFGAEGQQVCIDAVAGVGREIGKEVAQVLEGEMPTDLSEAERGAFIASWMNRNVYASPDVVKVTTDDEFQFDILWCPHQDIYSPRDCRLQRYFVQGIMEGYATVSAREQTAGSFAPEILKMINRGDDTCLFRFRRIQGAGKQETWGEYSERLAERELRELKGGKKQRMTK